MQRTFKGREERRHRTLGLTSLNHAETGSVREELAAAFERILVAEHRTIDRRGIFKKG